MRNLALSGALAVSATVASAAANEIGVPFVVPSHGPAAGSAVDQSALNAPIERIVRDGSHLRGKSSGERIRIYGMNVGGPEIFPATREQIDAMVERLARSGFNSVRLHHLDNMWSRQSGNTLWKPGDGRLEIDPAKLDHLHYALAAFKRHNIYVNLNLKVSKELSVADGLPAPIDGSFTHQKRVDRFFPSMIEHQKSFARTMLNTVNPHTGQAPKDDPAVAFVEINNENSILALWPGMEMGKEFERLAKPYQDELARRWNQWLERRYATASALKTAWSEGYVPLGESVLSSRDSFVVNSQPHASATLESFREAASPEDALAPVRATVIRSRNVDWDVQLLRTGLKLKAGSPYTVSFDIRAEAPVKVRVSCERDGAPYTNYGLSSTANASPEWTTHRVTFIAGQTEPGAARLNFNIGAARVVELRNVRLSPGMGDPPLRAGESLGNLGLPALVTDAQRRDWIAFLMDLDREFTVEMTRFLRDEMGVTALIWDSQVQWGGMGGYQREADSDVIDTHIYWQHVSFPPGRSWSPTGWTVGRKSQVAAMANGEPNELLTLARLREAGKPFAVSEYDHASVNDYQVEQVPMFIAFAAVQDWDAIWYFAHGKFDGDLDRFGGFFDNTRNPSKFAFNSSMARVFRKGLIPPAGPMVKLPIGETPWEVSQYANGFWQKKMPDAPSYLTHRLGLLRVPFVDPVPEGSTGRVTIEQAASGPVFASHGEQAVVLTGFLGSGKLRVAGVSLDIGAMPDQFGSFTLVTLDDRPVAESRRLLITAGGRSENVGMGWNVDRTSVDDKWGVGPVHIAPMSGTVVVNSRANRVFALAPDGTRRSEVKAQRDGTALRFEMAASHGTVWYELVD